MNEKERLTRLRALAHPARLQIVSLLTGSCMSAAEVARELGTTRANASYHLRRLAAAGEVELVEEVTIRGGHARRYRCPPTAHEPQQLLEPDRQHVGGTEERGFFAVLANEMRRRAMARRRGGRAINTDAEVWVSPEVWDQAVTRVRDVTRDLHQHAVPARTPGSIRVSMTVALFAMDPMARPVDPEDDA